MDRRTPPRHRASPEQAERIEAHHRPAASSHPLRKKITDTLVLVLAALCFLVIPAALASIVLNSVDRQWSRCEVHSAVGVERMPRDPPQVQLSTSCGQLVLYRDGDVYLDSLAEAVALARKFRPQSEYEFKLGWLGRHPRLSALASLTVWDWRTT